MAEDRSPVHFDETARTVIRDTLNRYRKDHGIGAPRLRERIMKSDPLGRELPISTLQRFLRGTHRTGDMYLGMIEAFLTSEEAELKADGFAPELSSYEGFGAALAAFLGEPEDQAHQETALAELGGAYSPPEFQVPQITARIAPSEDGTHFAIEEEHVIALPDVIHRYEGALIQRSGQLFGVLRNLVTRVPRVYWLHPASARDEQLLTLKGQVSERLFKKPVLADQPLAALKVTLQQREQSS